MHLPLKWEFPGGKLHEGEAEADCIRREIREELGMEVEPVRRLPDVTHDYGDKHVVLLPFVCRYVSGELRLMEHADSRWLKPPELQSLDWCEADLPVVSEYMGLAG